MLKVTVDLTQMVSATMKQQSKIDRQLAMIKYVSKMDRINLKKRESSDKHLLEKVGTDRKRGHVREDKENIQRIPALENHFLADSDSEEFATIAHPSKLSLPVIVKTRNKCVNNHIPED